MNVDQELSRTINIEHEQMSSQSGNAKSTICLLEVLEQLLQKLLIN